MATLMGEVKKAIAADAADAGQEQSERRLNCMFDFFLGFVIVHYFKCCLSISLTFLKLEFEA